jgi:hypothetical protein
MSNSKVLDAVKRLDAWIERNGWAGYDPYDIKEIGFVKKITNWGNKNFLMKIVREVIFEIFYTFPIISRKIFNIKPKVNAKAMALFSKGYLDLYLSTKEKKYLKKSNFCINWLENNNSETTVGIGWGYPFDWQTEVLIPKFIPNGIVTTAVGDAFWGWYQFTGDYKYLNTCKDICEFLITLPIDNISDEQICFSYTPLSRNHVHNLNLFVAEYLIKIGKEIGENEWVNLGLKAVNYTIAYQYDDGAFDYSGPPDKLKNFSDNYHTGFVLRMLYSIWKLTEREDVYKSLKKCYVHYINNFFEDNEIPKLLPNRKYRVDIHSCAESINCLGQLAEIFPEGIKIAENIIRWTIDNMQDKSGYFYYALIKSRFIKAVLKSEIAYLRWGQAWMLKGLSNFFLRTDQNHD